MKYIAGTSGCDDSTWVAIDLTDEQAEGVRVLAAATVEKSHYGCQPVIEVWPYDEAPSYQRDAAEETDDDN